MSQDKPRRFWVGDEDYHYVEESDGSVYRAEYGGVLHHGLPDVPMTAYEPVSEVRAEEIRREAWIAGYQRAEKWWSDEHRCCPPSDDTERDEEYREWRAKSTAETGFEQ